MKIRGNTVGTPLKPEKAVVKCQNLTEEEKALARKNIGAAVELLTVFSDAGNIASSNSTEIMQHIVNGGDAIYTDGNGFIYPLVGCESGYAIFEHSSDDGFVYRAEINPNGSVTFYERFNLNEDYVNSLIDAKLGVIENGSY